MTKIAIALFVMFTALHAAGQDSKSGASNGSSAVPPPRLLGRAPATSGALVTPEQKPAGAASMPITAPPKGTLGTMPPTGKPPIGSAPPAGKGPLGEPVKADTTAK